MARRLCASPVALLCCSLLLLAGPRRAETSRDEQRPLVFLSILARNQEHTLRNFLGYVEKLDYPKDRIAVWIRTDHSEDNTTAMLREWSRNAEGIYASVDFEYSDVWLYPTFDPFEMFEERYLHMAQLRQQSLDTARDMGADYFFSMDCDNFLLNNRTLSVLMEQEKPIVAPMLESGKDSAYSNFWCGQGPNGYYMRTPDYIPTVTRQRAGCFQVPVVFASFLVDLRMPESERLVVWPAPQGFTGPVDDVVQFAYSARKEGMDMYVLNTEFFGYIVKPNTYPSLQEAAEDFVNFKLQTMVNHPPVPTSDFISPPATPPSNLGLDAVFMISLARRLERRNRMLACLNELNFNYTVFDAVDGKQLNQTYIDGLGIRYLPGWKDPWGMRPMTFGEVGCFLSHYSIWQQVLSDNLEKVLVLEDDIDFVPGFRERLVKLLSEAEAHIPGWDLIYVGRKALHWMDEKLLPETTCLVKPAYSYWTLGYLVSHSGAEKLVQARPFDNLLPVDEYFPIMFNEHPQEEWAAHFETRNLNAYSSYPLLAFPTHYVGDDGWFSDTEPPVEILEKIRQQKERQQEEEERARREEGERQRRVREQAKQRMMESLKQRLKTEL